MPGLQRNSSRGGWPSPAEEELTDIMRLEDWLVERKEATYLLTMKGDSMKDAGILDGDVVVVERGASAKKQPPTTTEKFLGAGKPVARPKPKPPDSRVSAEFEPAASKDTPQSRPGYKQRRSAAERKADGSYKPRQRNVPKPKP